MLEPLSSPMLSKSFWTSKRSLSMEALERVCEGNRKSESSASVISAIFYSQFLAHWHVGISLWCTVSHFRCLFLEKQWRWECGHNLLRCDRCYTEKNTKHGRFRTDSGEIQCYVDLSFFNLREHLHGRSYMGNCKNVTITIIYLAWYLIVKKHR